MTNYINSITVEGTSYPIGPYRIDDNENIIPYYYSSSLGISSAILVASSVANVTSCPTVIIGGHLEGDGIGNTRLESGGICISSTNGIVVNISNGGATIANEITLATAGGAVAAGCLALNYEVISEPTVFNVSPPTAIYAAGVVSVSRLNPGNDANYTVEQYDVFNYTYINRDSAVNNSRLILEGVSVAELDGVTYYGCIGNGYGFDNTPTIGFYSVGSSGVGISVFSSFGESFSGSLSITVYTNNYIPYHTSIYN